MRKHFASKCSSSYEPNNFCENISQAFIFKHFQTFCIQMHIIVRAQNHSISIFADLPILQGPSMHRPSKVLFTNMLVKTNANHNFSNFSIHNCHPAIRNTIPTYIPSYRKRMIPTLSSSYHCHNSIHYASFTTITSEQDQCSARVCSNTRTNFK